MRSRCPARGELALSGYDRPFGEELASLRHVAPPTPAVRRALASDVDPVAGMLGRAFVTDPIASYLFPEPAGREERLRRFFALQLRHNYLSRGEVYVAEGAVAAALWMPPSPGAVGLADLLAHVPLVRLLAGRFLATRRLSLLLAERHPRARHYYLGTIGTDPDSQRRGIGSALLSPVLARCDTYALPAYLECSKRENVAFYGHHGFAVRDEVLAPEGGPPLWLMWREPLGSR